jgi:hypothetical protein
MWLNVHLHKRLRFDLFAQRFPRDIAEDHELADEESATHPPLNYGEAAIVLPSTGGNEDQVSDFSRLYMMASQRLAGMDAL